MTRFTFRLSPPIEATVDPFAEKAVTESISAPLTTCLSKMSLRAAESPKRLLKTSLSILLKASLVGAKTVNVAVSSLSVDTRSAALRAVTRVEKALFEVAISTTD